MIRPQEGGLSKIVNISVHGTSITTDNLIHLLDAIDTSVLESLNIGNNLLII
jgi:hypothetical protein